MAVTSSCRWKSTSEEEHIEVEKANSNVQVLAETEVNWYVYLPLLTKSQLTFSQAARESRSRPEREVLEEASGAVEVLLEEEVLHLEVLHEAEGALEVLPEEEVVSVEELQEEGEVASVVVEEEVVVTELPVYHMLKSWLRQNEAFGKYPWNRTKFESINLVLA